MGLRMNALLVASGFGTVSITLLPFSSALSLLISLWYKPTPQPRVLIEERRLGKISDIFVSITRQDKRSHLNGLPACYQVMWSSDGYMDECSKSSKQRVWKYNIFAHGRLFEKLRRKPNTSDYSQIAVVWVLYQHKFFPFGSNRQILAHLFFCLFWENRSLR